jgi:1-acyl-sn-glycerol-3-phosphate acyltransferase
MKSMSEMQIRTRCKALTHSGDPCKNFALAGSEYCRIHQGAADNGNAILPEGLPEEAEPSAFELPEIEETLQENQGIIEKMQKVVKEDLMDPDTWKGIWYMLNYSLESQSDFVRRRMKGDYETDEWGLDQEVLDTVKPFFDFLYKTYWRVEVSGLENIPEAGRALLVSNHSGQLPWDGAMVGLSVYSDHPAHRLVRTLYATWFPTLPFFSALFTKLGQALATEENGIRLLEQEELVAVFPEGYKGVGKLYKDRYRLARFGRGGFIRMALKTQAPVIPVSVIGAEETYISLAKSPTMAKLIGFPYFPVSPTFPWLGLLGFVPLPTKWYIDFGSPIPMDGYGPSAADNLVLVSQLTDQVRNIVQQMIYQRLAERKSVFFG